MKLKAILSFLFLGLLIIPFQNCADTKTSFSKATSAEVAAGNNGVGDFGAGGGGYSCVPGRRLAIYLDPDNDGVIVDENYLGSVVSYSGSLSPQDNYNYYIL